MIEWTDLRAATYNCDVEEVKRLLRAGTDVNAADAGGFTALHWCAFRAVVGEHQPEIAQLLLDHGASTAALTKSDHSALSWAIKAGSLEVVEVLLRGGADPNLCPDEVTPLMAAATDRNAEMVALLIRYGAKYKPREGRFINAYAVDNLADRAIRALLTPDVL